MSLLSPTDKLIRKLRKKLRQIEHLEFIGRASLNEEELLKVKQKNAIRAELCELLKQAENNDNSDVFQVDTSDSQKRETSFEETAKTETIEFNLNISEAQHSVIVGETLQSVNEKERPILEELANSKSKKKQKVKSANPPPVAADDTMKRSTSDEIPASSSPQSTPIEAPNKKSKSEVIQPTQQQTAKKNTAPMVKATPPAPVVKAWHEIHQFVYNGLEAHSDMVCCVDLDDDFIISGSRDTLVQVWDAKSGHALMNLRGHTNTVTCVRLLSAQQSQALNSSLSGAESTENETHSLRLALSASSDCCLKLWNMDTGSALSSIYTFSGVAALCYLPEQQYCVIGSEGGKLEVYNFLEDETNPLDSQTAFEGGVSSMKMEGDNLICSSLDGLISVWLLRGSKLSRIYQSEDLVSVGKIITVRPILCAAPASDSRIFFGDDGSSIKILSWKTGLVKKLRNHVHEFGLTDAVCVTDSYLLASSLNLDTGNSTINIRSLSDLKNLGTLSIPRVGRIVCLVATEDKNKNLRLVVGGTKLVLLETRLTGCSRSPKKDAILKVQLVSGLSLEAGDSEDEDTESSSEEEDKEASDSQNNLPPSKSSWCIIM